MPRTLGFGGPPVSPFFRHWGLQAQSKCPWGSGWVPRSSGGPSLRFSRRLKVSLALLYKPGLILPFWRSSAVLEIGNSTSHLSELVFASVKWGRKHLPWKYITIKECPDCTMPDTWGTFLNRFHFPRNQTLPADFCFVLCWGLFAQHWRRKEWNKVFACPPRLCVKPRTSGSAQGYLKLNSFLKDSLCAYFLLETFEEDF
jgi:hypothetical protein